MENSLGRRYIEEMVSLVFAIASGQHESVQALLDMTVPGRAPELIGQLAEAIGTIVVQNEAKEFQLELMIKDLLAAQLALEKARHDPLTGLPNRAMFQEILNDKCRLAQESGKMLALLFVDLDKFKQINDTLGHQAGDELLIKVAARLQEKIDGRGIVARQGGDEFTMLLPQIESEEIATDVASRIISGLNQPFDLAAGRGQVSCSVGLSFYPKEADSPLTLLKNADVAMYRAKHSGRSTFSLYNDAANEQSLQACRVVDF